jgi:hypothetical protein
MDDAAVGGQAIVEFTGGVHFTGGRSSDRVWITQADLAIKFGALAQQGHVRFPVGRDRADIHPVTAERIRKSSIICHNLRMMFLLKSWAELVSWASSSSCCRERLTEDVDAHRCQSAVGLFGFLGEFCNPPIGVNAHNAEALHLIWLHLHHRDREIGLIVLMEPDQVAVILFVNVIAG